MSRRDRAGALVLALTLVACGAPADETTEGDVTSGASEPSVAPPASPSPNPTTTGLVVSPDELVGIWRVERGDMLLELAADGRYASDTHGVLGRSPDVVGTWEIVDDELHFDQTADSIDCPDAAAADARFIDFDDGTFTIEWTYNSCYPDGVGDHWAYVRLSPDERWEPPIPAELPPVSQEISPGSTRGAWLIEGTSTILELHDDGTYVLDDAGMLAFDPMESGTYFATAGRIELTVVTSRHCQTGTQRVLTDARAYVTNPAFRFIPATTDDPCGMFEESVTLVIASS